MNERRASRTRASWRSARSESTTGPQLGDLPLHRLAHPPRGVGPERRAERRVVALEPPEEPDHALLHELSPVDGSRVLEVPRDRAHERHVRLHQLLARLGLVPLRRDDEVLPTHLPAVLCHCSTVGSGTVPFLGGFDESPPSAVLTHKQCRQTPDRGASATASASRRARRTVPGAALLDPTTTPAALALPGQAWPPTHIRTTLRHRVTDSSRPPAPRRVRPAATGLRAPGDLGADFAKVGDFASARVAREAADAICDELSDD